MAQSKSATDRTTDDQQPARFDEALAELEGLVEHLEQGDLSLEESLTQFERGVSLARQCRDALAAAEQKVQMLSTDDTDEELTDLPESSEPE